MTLQERTHRILMKLHRLEVGAAFRVMWRKEEETHTTGAREKPCWLSCKSGDSWDNGRSGPGAVTLTYGDTPSRYQSLVHTHKTTRVHFSVKPWIFGGARIMQMPLFMQFNLHFHIDYLKYFSLGNYRLVLLFAGVGWAVHLFLWVRCTSCDPRTIYNSFETQ